MVADELIANPDRYTVVGYSRERVIRTGEEAKNNGAFGGDLELRAFSYLMNCQITLYQFPEEPRVYGTDNPYLAFAVGFFCHNHYDIMMDEQIAYDGETIQIPDDSSPSSHSSQGNNQRMNETEIAAAVESSTKIWAQAQGLSEGNSAKMTLTDLLRTHLKDNDSTVRWLQSLGILYSERQCPKCGKNMHFREKVKGRADGDFCCTTCNTRASVRKENIMAELKVPLKSVVQAYIMLFEKNPIAYVSDQTKISTRSLTRYEEDILVASSLLVENRNSKIGGKGRVVEIDECLLHRRKYHVGRAKESGWVLGGVERPRTPTEKPRIFLVSVPNRQQNTLEEYIQRWVEPGTIIITDCLASYNHLDELGYYHFTVNHSENFVDQLTHAHTERIEGLWHWIRRHAIPNSGCHLEDVNFYLSSYLYKRSVNSDIIQFLKDICSIPKATIDRLIQERHQVKQEFAEVRAKEKEERDRKLAQERQSNHPDQTRQTEETPTSSTSSVAPESLVRATRFSSPRKRGHHLPPRPQPDPQDTDEESESSSSWTKDRRTEGRLTEFNQINQMRSLLCNRYKHSKTKAKPKSTTTGHRGRPKGRRTKSRGRRIELSQEHEDSAPASSASLTISSDTNWDNPSYRKPRTPRGSGPKSPSL